VAVVLVECAVELVEVLCSVVVAELVEVLCSVELVEVLCAVELVEVLCSVELVEVLCSVVVAVLVEVLCSVELDVEVLCSVVLLNDVDELELALPVVQCGFCWSDLPWSPPLAWSFERQPGTLPSLLSVPGPPLPHGPLVSPWATLLQPMPPPGVPLFPP
jgi:hypothetical protein